MQWPSIFRQYYFNINDEEVKNWQVELDNIKASDAEVCQAIRNLGIGNAKSPRVGHIQHEIIHRVRQSNIPKGCTLCRASGWITISQFRMYHRMSVPCICKLGKWRSKNNKVLFQLAWDYIEWVAGLTEDAKEMNSVDINDMWHRIQTRKKERENNE